MKFPDERASFQFLYENSYAQAMKYPTMRELRAEYELIVADDKQTKHWYARKTAFYDAMQRLQGEEEIARDRRKKRVKRDKERVKRQAVRERDRCILVPTPSESSG